MGLASELAAAQKAREAGVGTMQQGSYPPAPGELSQAQLVNTQQISSYKQLLLSTIQEKQLQFFYSSNDPRLDHAATLAATHIDEVCTRWNLPLCQELAKVALFDIILFIDNSASLALEEDGERLNDLHAVLVFVVQVVRLFNDDGVTLQLMNARSGESTLENVKDVTTIKEYLKRPGLFHGTTPIGTRLQQQILDDTVTKAQRLCLPKPVLVITITDGIPVGEVKSTLRDVICEATRAVARTKCGSGTISFQFAQVGNDGKAQDFLAQLDKDPDVGHLVNCTSNYEHELEQMMRANPPVDLTPELWLLKMLVGAIDL